MAKNLQIDDALIAKVVKVGGHCTKKSAVTQALIEYIQHREQQKITTIFGKVDYRPDYNHKKQRTVS